MLLGDEPLACNSATSGSVPSGRRTRLAFGWRLVRKTDGVVAYSADGTDTAHLDTCALGKERGKMKGNLRKYP